MKITAYPEDTSPANNDLLLTVDVSSGTNKKVTVTNLINTIADIANLPVNGWFGSNSSVSSVTYNGNRSYSVVTGTNLSSTISAGMRLRTTRTVSAPTQCTSLNGTNQYFNRTSANLGSTMTFTDDFVVSAWVKVSSYSAGYIASRYNGTSGWALNVNASGQLVLSGYNAGAANTSYIASYQSVPLNKWVHISAQLDMSSFTASTTTSYIMFDGVDVPAFVARGGTNPTALVQAGNLEIGSNNGGSSPFAGKIAQVAIFNAKVTQATIRGYISQGLAGNETSLISAYSFNNSINDLNTTNANNLTAQNSAVATNADSPFGGQADGTISSTLDYGIVQRVSGTTLTVQVAEGNTIPTSGGVSSISYSNFKAPYGMPMQKDKWRIMSLIKTDTNNGSSTSNTWYNVCSYQLSVPVGSYNLGAYIIGQASTATSVVHGFSAAIATAAGNARDIAAGVVSYCVSVDARGLVVLDAGVNNTTQTTYYINIASVDATAAALYLVGSSAGSSDGIKIFADNAFL